MAKNKRISPEIEERAIRILRRSEMLGGVNGGEDAIERGMNMDTRRYLVSLLRDGGMPYDDIATVLRISRRTVDNDIVRITYERIRNIPPNWLAAQVRDKYHRLDLLGQKNFADAERASDWQERATFRRLAAEAAKQAADILTKIISPDVFIGVLDGNRDEKLDRMGQLQNAFRKRMLGNGSDPVEAARLVGPNGEEKK